MGLLPWPRFFHKHDRLLSASCAIIQKNRKGGAFHEDGAAHRHFIASCSSGKRSRRRNWPGSSRCPGGPSSGTSSLWAVQVSPSPPSRARAAASHHGGIPGGPHGATAPEMQAILAGLRSLDSVSGTRRYAQLMEKLSAGTGGLVPGGAHMLIDLSSWYKTSLPPKIECSRRPSSSIVPYSLPIFPPRGNRCTLLSPIIWCFTGPPGMYGAGAGMREDFRLFKLNRMTELTQGQPFSPRQRTAAGLYTGETFSGKLSGYGPL